jgi:UDP-3-O-acyl-N-acetylglucosamine deacetylase
MMMPTETYGKVVAGDENALRQSWREFHALPVDWDLHNGDYPANTPGQTTIHEPVTLTGPGTFFGKATRTITFEPCEQEGWWFDRSDMPDSLPTRVSVRNVWTTGDIVSNIVLRSGSPHNYVRMVEHIIALKVGMGIDNVMIRIDSGDPPLFNRGSLDLVEALGSSGARETDRPATLVTVKEPVTAVAPHGGFVTLLPCSGSRPQLNIDCAVNFPNAIGRQRIRFPLVYDHFRMGAEARTNTTAGKKLYCQTIGKIFADVRNLGYTADNVLVAAKRRYINEPHLLHDGKSLEAVWHRAVLDLLAAVALIDRGRFVGDIISYKAGHTLDVHLITLLYLNDLLQPFDA